jgi:3'-5' exoribonuclease
MILSHHGELEYGSPKRPKILEAVLLHFIENMNAKVTAFNGAI